MHDLLSAIAALLPERYRPLVAALAALFAASQTVASQIVAQLPSSSADDPRYGKIVRAMHWYGHARFRDEPGTIKPCLSGCHPAERARKRSKHRARPSGLFCMTRRIRRPPRRSSCAVSVGVDLADIVR